MSICAMSICAQQKCDRGRGEKRDRPQLFKAAVPVGPSDIDTVLDTAHSLEL
jgi:hypothetical protein